MMNEKPAKIIRRHKNLLIEVLSKRSPDLLNSIEKIGTSALSIQERDAIIDIISDELCKNGLQGDSEPNKKGLILDDLIGALLTQHPE